MIEQVRLDGFPDWWGWPEYLRFAGRSSENPYDSKLMKGAASYIISLEEQISELREYKWMYEDLSK